MNREVALRDKSSTACHTEIPSYEKINHLNHKQLHQIAKQLRDEVGSLHHDLQAASIETEALRARNVQLDKENAERSATIQNTALELSRVRERAEAVTEENHIRAVTTKDQKRQIKKLLEKNKELESEVSANDANAAEKAAKVRMEMQDLHQTIANMRDGTFNFEQLKTLKADKILLHRQYKGLNNEYNALIESSQSQIDRNAELESKVEKMDRKKKRMVDKLSKLEDKTQSQEEHIETLTAASDEAREANVELNRITVMLEKEKEEVIKTSQGYAGQLSELDNELQQSRASVAELRRDLEMKNERERRTEAALEEAQRSLKHKSAAHSNQTEKIMAGLSDKDTFIERLEGDILRLQQQSQAALHTPQRGRGARAEPPASVHELQYQREIARQAKEKASDMESKLEAMKLAMEAMKSELQTEKAEVNARKAETDAKKAEVEALAKKCAERMNAANAKESYTMSLEKQLEEMRGNMEGMLGRVSVYQGKKRRRTEGPDFQL